MKNALITGGAGFIGYHLTNYLKNRGWWVLAIDNYFHPCKAMPRVMFGDVRQAADLEKLISWCDVVFHLAAQIHVDYSIRHPQETIDINVSGTLNVLEAARKHKKKVVFASTSEVYGTSQGVMDEHHPLDAQSPYGASKVAGDRLCKAYQDTYGLDVSILRNFNTFGPYQNDGSYGSVIAIFTRAALLNKPLYIFGDGTQERDYMWITDAIRGYEICAFNKIDGPLNIGTGKTISIKELAQFVKKLTKSKSPIIHTKPRDGEVQRLCAGIEKAKAIGFEPETDLEKHLSEYVEWARKHENNSNGGFWVRGYAHHTRIEQAL